MEWSAAAYYNLYMMRRVLFFLLPLFALPIHAQRKVKDAFTNAPDSVFPLLTTNNKLDCVDLIENKREARVKNRMEQEVVMTELTDSYLRMEMSPRSVVEMKMLNDTTFCLIQTYMGPAPDSHISFYSQNWEPLDIHFDLPKVAEFWTSVPDSVARDAHFAQRSLEDITLVQICASAESDEITLTLQTSELAEKEKEIAQQYVQPLRYRWNGRRFER